MTRLRRLVLERLMRYYRFLTESTTGKESRTVTSAQIAEALEIDPTQVRKDFAAIGLQGTGRVGFDVGEVCRAIRVTLGFDRQCEAVLIGTGHLGSTLLAYSGFARYGFHIVAAFDKDPLKIGRKIARCTVKSTRAVTPFVRNRRVRLAILAPPTEVSKALTDRLVSAGVRAIWNFTPTRMKVPSGVLVRNEQHFSIGLSEIGYFLKQ